MNKERRNRIKDLFCQKILGFIYFVKFLGRDDLMLFNLLRNVKNENFLIYFIVFDVFEFEIKLVYEVKIFLK